MKKILLFLLVIMAALVFSSCIEASDAQVASHNMSKDADMFRVYRRVVFYNGITDEYILFVEGFCSINVDSSDDQLELTVKVGEGQYFKHYLGLSDNVTYFVEQMSAANVDPDHYKVIFKPKAIIPHIEIAK